MVASVYCTLWGLSAIVKVAEAFGSCANVSNAPNFHDEFLECIAIAFRKRRKALTHKTSRAEYAKVHELIGDKREERLEIYLGEGTRPRGTPLRLHAWIDRLTWLDARKPNARRSTEKGWAWSWNYEGRLLAPHLAPAIINALEETLPIL